MEIVNPTRMNLLLKKEEINIASNGAELLRHKRDVLLIEFFSTIKFLMTLRESLDDQSHQSILSLIHALGWEGRERLISHTFVAPQQMGFEIDYKNLWGIKIPRIAIEKSGGEKRDGLGRADTGLIIDETRQKFQDFLNLALKSLPEELKIRRLGQEIKNTSRKINSLEKYVIPKLSIQVKYIYETLQEREREDVFRLKRLKRKLEKRWR